MPSPEKDIAVGLSFTFGSTLIDDRKIIDYTLPEAIAVLVDMTDQSAAKFFDFDAADLKDAGKLRIMVFHFQDYDYWAEVGTKAALVLTLPSGTTITSSAVYESYTPSSQTINDRMVAEALFQLTPGSGEPAIVAA